MALEIAMPRDSSRIRIRVDGASALANQEKRQIKARVARMLRLDDDLADFYHLCRAKGQHWTRVTQGMGRLLRSPTVFEDVVKTICTTNIQWSGTKRLIEGLVQEFGEPFPGDEQLKSFPDPTRLAQAPPGSFTKTVRLGYRGAYIRRLAEQVASAELDLEILGRAGRPTEEVRKQLLGIKGVGNYAASTLLMLLGHYDYLGIDSVFREFVSERYFNGEYPSDDQAQGVYAEWGKWKYLAYWFELWSDG